MAVDTRNKRASCLGLAFAAALVLPAPDGAIDAADRQQTAYCYAGIAAAPPTPTPPTPAVEPVPEPTTTSGAAVRLPPRRHVYGLREPAYGQGVATVSLAATASGRATASRTHTIGGAGVLPVALVGTGGGETSATAEGPLSIMGAIAPRGDGEGVSYALARCVDAVSVSTEIVVDGDGAGTVTLGVAGQIRDAIIRAADEQLLLGGW